MKKITQRFIGFLMILAVLLMSVIVDVPTVEANTPPETSYTFENGILPRKLYCDGLTDKIDFYVGDFYYSIGIDSNPIMHAYCDKYGTLWLMSIIYAKTGFPIYWVNPELEGENMTPHYFNEGGFMLDGFNYVYSCKNAITNEEILLPTPDDLKNYLENGIPVPGSKPKPTIDPEPATQVTPTIKKVTNSGNTIRLINSNNEVVDKATFNKKKAFLSYKGKKITKVKGAWFTPKGKIVYIRGSKSKYKAYYFDGKKSTLIKSGVSSVSTSKKFATALKLKNGKTYQLK